MSQTMPRGPSSQEVQHPKPCVIQPELKSQDRSTLVAHYPWCISVIVGCPFMTLLGILFAFIHYQIPCYPEHVSTHFWQNMMKISIQLCLHNYDIAMSEILGSTFPRSWDMDVTNLDRSYQ